MTLKEKLDKVDNFIQAITKETDNISIDDIKQIESYYKWSDGTIFTYKMVSELNMWKSFEKDYDIDKCGGIQLLRILLDRILNREDPSNQISNDKFIENYIAYEKKNSNNI